jgi:hypothetical protein
VDPAAPGEQEEQEEQEEREALADQRVALAEPVALRALTAEPEKVAATQAPT